MQNRNQAIKRYKPHKYKRSHIFEEEMFFVNQVEIPNEIWLKMTLRETLASHERNKYTSLSID